MVRGILSALVRLRARTVGLTAVAATLFAGFLANAEAAEERTLTIYNIHTKETVSATFKRDGKFVTEELAKLNHVMRDWRRNQSRKMDPELIDLIWRLHTELGSQKPVHLISGFRSRATNNSLRRRRGGQARNSRHILGMAADIHFPDIKVKDLRNSALIRERGGVGYYPKSGIPFVHVDTDRVRHWPRLPRRELAMLFPDGKTKHIPSDGRRLTKRDGRIALAKLKKMGLDRWQPSSRPAPAPAATLVAEAPKTEQPSPAAKAKPAERVVASVMPTAIPSLTDLIKRVSPSSPPTLAQTTEITGSISPRRTAPVRLDPEAGSQLPIVTAAASEAGREPFALVHPDQDEAGRLLMNAEHSPLFAFEAGTRRAPIHSSLRFKGSAIRTFASVQPARFAGDTTTGPIQVASR